MENTPENSPPPVPPANPTSGKLPAGAEVDVSSEEKVWGMIGHLSGLLGYIVAVGQIVGPLVVWLIYKDKSRFVAFHALQTLYFHIAVLIVIVIMGFLVPLTCGASLLGMVVVGLLAIIMPIIGAIEASKGRLFEYWVVGAMAREHVGV